MPRLFWVAAQFERHPLAGPFLQRLAIGDDGLFELRRPALALPEDLQRKPRLLWVMAQVERHALAGLFLQRLAIGDDGLFELRRPALALPERL